ncbi:MAG: CocE/NonD family hydrolase [Caldilineaceae bacterium]
MVPMRDGVQLATDIYRPADGAPTPVLMARTPYNKEGILGGNSLFRSNGQRGEIATIRRGNLPDFTRRPL